MRCRYIVLLGLLSTVHAHAAEQGCAHPGKANPLGAKIAAAAINEYREFNGHRINANGMLWKFGSVESETELLHDPATGLKDTSRPGRFAWRRVWEYWLTLDRHGGVKALSRKIISVPGLLENPEATDGYRETGLAELFSKIGSGDQHAESVLKEAAVRAALNDSPWSAVFISYLMDQANLSEQQFRYSASHWRYIQRAFEQPDGYAYRACDPRTTIPKVGDLVCYSRGKQPLKDFAEWQRDMQDARFPVAAHCDAVVNVDIGARKLETIGGNVLQSVTWRKLKLNGAKVLSDTHHPDRHKANKNSECQQDKTCDQPNLNLQYWGVLLQLK
jgi:hypothetical protein